MTQFSALLFFSVLTRSSQHRHLQVVFIFKSSSSSSHHHLQFFFIFKSPSYLSHFLLQVFFITRSGSSRLLDHHCIIIKFDSSLDLDHHQVWIIITSGSSLDLDHHHQCYLRMVLSLDSSCHRKFYRASPFSCWL